LKRISAIVFFSIIWFSAYSQTDSVKGNQFHLTGKIKDKIQMTPDCGVVAWGTVIEFEIIDLVGIDYKNKTIGIIVMCPEFYKKNFFQNGKAYQVVFSDRNQADFGYAIPNRELLKKNSLSFDPYVISIKELQ
jgi:hypothetical protein